MHQIMILLRKMLEATKYHHVVIKVNKSNLPKTKQDKIEDFLIRAIRSYFSIDSVLDKEGIFNLLAYNFATSNLHFLINATNADEIEEFTTYLHEQYESWIDREVEFVTYKNYVIDPDMVLDISAHIHTLGAGWERTPHSSLRCYLYDDAPVWLASQHIKQIYGNAVDYYEFLKVYKYKEFLIDLKSFATYQTV